MYRRVRWRVRKRRRPVLLAATLALVGVVVYVLLPGEDLRAGSTELPDGPVRIARRVPKAYRIVYRVENRAGDELVVSTDELLVRRPFDGRLESRAGRPPGRKRSSLTVNAFARLRLGDNVLALSPAPAPQDQRPDALLREAQRAGYVEARERRRVAGRACRVYRVAPQPESGSLRRLSSKHPDYLDVCFDEAGLALEEVNFVGGKLLNRRVAIAVDETPSARDEMFRLEDPTLGVTQGGGSVREVDPSSRSEGKFWELRAPPTGFEHKGRYAVVPPQTGFDDPTQRSSIVTLVSDVWVRGIDALVVEQGGTLGGSAPFRDDPNARRVRLGALGRGELLYGLRTAEVRVRRGGRFVRVLGTLPPSRLLAAARSLEEKEGGSLVYLDEAPS